MCGLIVLAYLQFIPSRNLLLVVGITVGSLSVIGLLVLAYLQFSKGSGAKPGAAGGEEWQEDWGQEDWG